MEVYAGKYWPEVLVQTEPDEGKIEDEEKIEDEGKIEDEEKIEGKYFPIRSTEQMGLIRHLLYGFWVSFSVFSAVFVFT